MTGFITLADAKLQLRVDYTDEDVIIQKHIDAASRHVEDVTGYVAPVRSGQIFRFNCFENELRLPLRPIDLETVAVSYDDTDEVEQSFADFRTIEKNGFTRLVPKFAKSWPSASSVLAGTVKVTADAGYDEDDADCPEDLKHAVRLLVGHWFLHREAVSSSTKITLPIGVATLLDPDRARRM